MSDHHAEGIVRFDQAESPGWWRYGLVVVAAALTGTSCVPPEKAGPEDREPSSAGETLAKQPDQERNMTTSSELSIATFGNGCFWCTEAVFQRLKGVNKVVSGYTGGSVANPTYKQVCGGMTGHAEAIQVKYDPNTVSYEELLEVFWKTHDPTTLNRQGADEGTQYRSVVFYHNQRQKELAEHYKKKLDGSGVFDAPIVTEISPASEFFAAEEEHQDFYNRQPSHGYCSFIIRPKIEKLEQVFADKLKQPTD